MLCDQKCELLPLSRTERGVAVTRGEVDRPVPFVEFLFIRTQKVASHLCCWGVVTQKPAHGL